MSEPLLYADDTSVIISNRDMKSFYSVSNLVVSNVIKYFDANNLVLNVDKINIMKFINKEFIMSCITYWSWRNVLWRDGEYKISWFTNW